MTWLPWSRVQPKKLLQYMQAGKHERVLEILRQDTVPSEVLQATDSHGRSILHLAALEGQMEVLYELLLRHKLSTTMVDSDGNTPLHHAASRNHRTAVEVLLRCGADPVSRNRSGKLPSQLASVPAVEELFHRDNSGIFSPVVNKTHPFFSTDAVKRLADSDSSPTSNAEMQDLCATPKRVAYDESAVDAASLQDAERGALEAARETTLLLHSSVSLFELRPRIIGLIRTKKQDQLIKYLEQDSNLPMQRLLNVGGASDGQTYFHFAASLGDIEMMKLMKSKASPSFTFWVRDVQGRTPLHVAAENGHTEACIYLRDAMRVERGQDPSGLKAPVDLAGETPIGYAKLHAGGRPPEPLRTALFERGDNSVFSPTSFQMRSGSSPWRASSPTKNTEVQGMHQIVGFNLQQSSPLYALSAAHGWTPAMEDRMTVLFEVPGRKSWSIYAVFDGHGGSFSSSFLSDSLPGIVDTVCENMNLKDLDESTDSPLLLKSFLENVCAHGETLLKNHPRMKVLRLNSGRLECLDSSGSTGLLLLVTPSMIAAGNVGDCRAVLALQTLDALQPVPLSRDHKLTILEERERCLKASALVNPLERDGVITGYEVYTKIFDGRLRMSRSFGDFYLKQNADLPAHEQAVIAVPEVNIHMRSPLDGFVVLACDGIWDVMSNEEVVQWISEYLATNMVKYDNNLQSHQKLIANTCDALIEECLVRGAHDNLSVILIFPGRTCFPNPTVEQSGNITPLNEPTEDNFLHRGDIGCDADDVTGLTGALAELTSEMPPHPSLEDVPSHDPKV